MSALATRAWATAHRLRRKVGKPSKADDQRRREAWIAEHARGRSFADIGGLYGVDGHFSFHAESAGATAVTCFDAGDPTLSTALGRRDAAGSKVRFVQGDLEDPVAVERVARHDVVWCKGVIYHTPNPVLQLVHLRRITGELLFLGSHTIPEVPGFEHACVYLPYLSDDARRAHASAHWRAEETGAGAIGVPYIDTPMLGHGNFWWGMSPSALRAMVRTACFEIVDEPRTHASPWFTDLVLRPVDRAPSLPPPEYYRERADARAAGEPAPPWERFYAERGFEAGPPPADAGE